MQLTVKSTRDDNGAVTQTLFAGGDYVTMFRPLYLMTEKWPGIKSYWCGFTDPIFGRYKSLTDLDRVECEVAEEEDDDYMDATAQSASLESASLEAADTEGEASVHNDGEGTRHTECSKGLTDQGRTCEVERAPTGDEDNHQGPECETDGEERDGVPLHTYQGYEQALNKQTSSNTIPLIKIRTT